MAEPTFILITSEVRSPTAKLYFLRDLVGKRKKTKIEKKDYKLWEEALSEEELAKIEEEKAKAAEEKKAQKAKEKEELDKKFSQAVASHNQEEEKTEEKKEESGDKKTT